MSKPKDLWVNPEVIKTNPRGVVYHASTVMLDGTRDMHFQLVDPARNVLFEEMLEALKLLKKEEAPGYHDCLDDGLQSCAWCVAKELIARAEEMKK